jgi:predicted RNase H-related nuclease YkuK (DUF458 family)
VRKIDLSKLTWCDAGSSVVKLEDVLKIVELSKYNCEIHVGCDSHFSGNKCVFAIVVALYEYGKGGTYFFARAKSDRELFKNLKIRLLKETELAIALAGMLDMSESEVSVHLDINPDPSFKSNLVFTSATAWVKSLGYKCIVKPDAWASSWLADAYAK